MTRSLIHEWHRSELAVPYPQVAGARMIMGCPLWGEPYVPRFLRYNLPSILASRDALAAFGWELVLYVDPPTWSVLNPFLYQMHVPVSLRCIPQVIMEVLRQGGVTKYWLLAAIHNLLVHEAGRRGAGFHMLVADITYSDRYFEHLIELAEHYDGIAQNGLTISFGGAEPLLEGFRQPNGTLAVPARSLGQIGWDNLVGEWKSWGMDDIDDPRDEMPNSHFIHYRARDAVHIHSAHMSAVWMGAAKCQAAGTGLGGTIDSELPRYVGRDFYIPTAHDDMSYVALDDGRGEPTAHTTFDAFKSSLLQLIDHRQDFMDYFRTPCVVPALSDGRYPPNDVIEKRFGDLMAMIEDKG